MLYQWRKNPTRRTMSKNTKIIPKESYHSAGAFPVKLFCVTELLQKRLRPLHLQLNLTNSCQLACSYCSCADRRDKKNVVRNVMDIYDLRHYLNIMPSLQACTITGGGEPLLYPALKEIIYILSEKGIKIGIVTNGIELKRLTHDMITRLTWIRISFDNARKTLPEIPDIIPSCKIAYSYVVSPFETDPKAPSWRYQTISTERVDNLLSLINEVKLGKATHLRIVSDIASSENTKYRLEFMNHMHKAKLNISSQPHGIIIQNRQHHTPGSKKCWHSLVKPVVDVDGQVYPCCGAQYAYGEMEKGSRRYLSKLSMGSVDEYIEKYVCNEEPFDGSVCSRCYYNAYNETLGAIVISRNIVHKEFL